MNILKATIRNTISSGQINKLREGGIVPAIVYGGTKENLKISLKKTNIEKIYKNENFLADVINLNIDGNEEKVLPREIAFDPISNEPIHIDFMRIVKGKKLILEIPVKFINNDKSPGLKKGGVLNIVRRKVELRCPSDNIPKEIILDLDGKEIGTSLKISSVKLPENVSPTILDRDFTIATVAAPTIVVEPEKPAEGEEAATTEEGEKPAEGEEATKTTDEKKASDEKSPDKEKSSDKEKSTDKDKKKTK